MLLALLLAAGSLVANYLEHYFAMYPTRATQAGRTDFDTRLEDLSPESLRETYGGRALSLVGSSALVTSGEWTAEAPRLLSDEH